MVGGFTSYPQKSSITFRLSFYCKAYAFFQGVSESPFFFSFRLRKMRMEDVEMGMEGTDSAHKNRTKSECHVGPTRIIKS